MKKKKKRIMIKVPKPKEISLTPAQIESMLDKMDYDRKKRGNKF